MESDMKWTLETYRLDEVARKFDLPCVVCVNEGFYSETESEGFSQGDIMSIDSRMVLHKVAANFAEDLEPHDVTSDYIELKHEHEILVPLNYKGKLKVLKHIQNFDSVRELALDFPRFAKMRSNLKVQTEERTHITITAGTVIELDRTIPGSHGTGQGKLVVQFRHMGQPIVVGLPMNLRGKFRTEPDETEYTIKEAIDRYSLPQHVRFVDDEIKRVYTQDLVDGIENMRTITETLQLNRLVTQEVLVGHYKPIEGTESTDTDRFKQRTLVVLPTDNPDIRDIEVNVLLNVTEDIYSDVFLVRNVSNTEELVDGTLYIDFVMSPGIKRITADEVECGASSSSWGTMSAPSTTPISTDDLDEAPPVPPRRGKPHQPPATKPKPKPLQKPQLECRQEEEEDYEQVSPPVTHGPKADFTLAGVNFEESSMTKNKPKQTLKNLFHKKIVAKVKPKVYDNKQPEDNELTEDVVYDEVDEKKIYDHPKHPRKVTHGSQPQRSKDDIPVARVAPNQSQKDFSELTVDELSDRLNKAKMTSMADLCRQEHLNGSFFKSMSKKDIQETFPLNKVELIKFMQMKDKNWIPPS